MTPYLIDSHAHLDFPDLLPNLPAVLARAAENGVRECVTIGIDLETSRTAVSIAETHENIFATIGVHPHEAHDISETDLAELLALARHPKCVAVGETGLDYHYNHQPRETQRRCMLREIELAREAGLPAVFHIREAYDDFFAVAAPEAKRLSGVVLHCFSGDWAVAERCLALGFYLSIPGTVTFAKAASVREVAARAPLDRLLLETDCPFLAPVPFRGKVNEPAYLLHTARTVAALRGAPLSEVARATTENVRRVFSRMAEGSAS